MTDGMGVKEFSKKWLYTANSRHHTGAYGRLKGVLEKTAAMAGMELVEV